MPKPTVNRHVRHIYLFITESPYGTEIYPYGTYQRATRALHARMEELFKNARLSEKEQEPHRERYRLHDSYELPLSSEPFSYAEHGYILTKETL